MLAVSLELRELFWTDREGVHDRRKHRGVCQQRLESLGALE